MHDQAAVDVEHALAHVNMFLQQHLQLVRWLQQEHVGGVGDEHLRERRGEERRGEERRREGERWGKSFSIIGKVFFFFFVFTKL